MKPAIVVVGYNRPLILKRLLDSIENANYKENDINLVISLDKATNENDVLKVADEFRWTHGRKHIRRFKERQGLRNHIIQCGDLTKEYGAVIILEDDLLVAPDFFEYTKKALDFYKDEESITGIALYSHEWNGYARKNFMPIIDQYDTYLGQYSITWGQCWTEDWWNKFKKWYLQHEGKLGNNQKIPNSINRWPDNSWGKYFVNYIVDKDKYYVIPRTSFTTNCSEIGEHAKISDNVHQVRMMMGKNKIYCFAPVKEAQKYDIYFENMKLEKKLPAEIQKEGVIVDLAGYGRKDKNKRYILTTLSFPYKVIKSYGLQLRPYEMNIFYGIQGNSIFLYDTTIKDKKRKSSRTSIMKYELRGFSVRDLMPYSFFLFVQSLKNKLIKRK